MPISILPPQLAQKIAAGEVIERPMNIVKELIENALDAQASVIHIHLQKGGLQSIEVIDNGPGIGLEDLQKATIRHATSKIHALEDLEHLSSHGFRGEALASIQAVSDLVIETRPKDSMKAFRFSDEQTTEIEPRHFLGTSHGTHISVRSLFTRYPVRLKFLKKPQTELNHIRDWVERIALAYPKVGFHLYQNQKRILQFLPSTPTERVKQFFLKHISVSLSNHTFHTETLPFHPVKGTLTLYWLRGYSLPHSRKVYLFLNRRVLKDLFLRRALLAPFQQVLLPGHFPCIALFLEIDPSVVDWNVHPMKTEVRFQNPQMIRVAISELVKKTLKSDNRRFQSSFTSSPAIPNDLSRPALPPHPSLSAFSSSPLVSTDFKSFYRSKKNSSTPSSLSPPLPPPPSLPSLSNSNTQSDRSILPIDLPLLKRYIGQIFKTYLLFETETAHLIWIDQHAADERIQYEKWKNKILKSSSPLSQKLTLKETLFYPQESLEKLSKKLPFLKKIGFEVQIHLQEEKIIFLSIPVIWDMQHLTERLQALLDHLLENPISQDTNLLIDEPVFEKLAKKACHGAIRAGQRLLEDQAWELVKSLLKGKHALYCPHGRPIWIEIDKSTLEKLFLRTLH